MVTDKDLSSAPLPTPLTSDVKFGDYWLKASIKDNTEAWSRNPQINRPCDMDLVLRGQWDPAASEEKQAAPEFFEGVDSSCDNIRHSRRRTTAHEEEER